MKSVFKILQRRGKDEISAFQVIGYIETANDKGEFESCVNVQPEHLSEIIDAIKHLSIEGSVRAIETISGYRIERDRLKKFLNSETMYGEKRNGN